LSTLRFVLIDRKLGFVSDALMYYLQPKLSDSSS
jgi:hypothetical protein